MDRLVFGTDGWRDIIADRFTFANVARCAQAYAEHLLERGQGRVVVGHDTRFNGERFAAVAAGTLAANGLEVLLSTGYLPTPALSFAVRHHGAGGGVMLTASHNPPAYHGFKLKGPYGGTATEEIYRDVAARVERIGASDVRRPGAGAGPIERFDVQGAYFDALERLVDVEALRRLEGRVVHEAMGGSATGWLAAFARRAGLALRVEELHPQPDPLFHGRNPEPLPQNLAAARERMRSGEALLLVATDGDGDRLGAVLPGGAFLNSHQIFAVLLDRMQRRGGRGRVVKTFTVSRVIERLAAKRGLEVVETPVGFKHIVDAMLAGGEGTGGVLIGGEESGGIGVQGHLPERDGIANGLLLLEAMAAEGRGVGEIFAGLEREAEWSHAYDRLDLHLSDRELVDRVMADLQDAPERFAGRPVASAEYLDGVKLNLGRDAWLLFRPSGTEPVLRVYCEAASDGEVAEVLDRAEAWVRGLGERAGR